MESETIPEIPEEIRNLMRADEIENMRNLDGWAVGIVTHSVYDGETVFVETIEDAWIELFNGDGTSGEFGGVRFMAIDDTGEYRESYAYIRSGTVPDDMDDYWYVAEYTHPENPDTGRTMERWR